VGLVQRFERRLEGMVGNSFARVFGGSVVPQEVDRRCQRESESNVRELLAEVTGPTATRCCWDLPIMTVSQALSGRTADHALFALRGGLSRGAQVGNVR